MLAGKALPVKMATSVAESERGLPSLRCRISAPIFVRNGLDTAAGTSRLVYYRLLLAQFLAFSGVGAVGTMAHYGILLVLVEWGSLSVMLATTLGFGVGAGVNYVLSRRIVFRSTVPFGRGLLKFLAIAAIGASLNAAIVAVLVSRMPVHYLLAQVVATGVVLVFNFVANRFWTFREISGESR